MASSYVIDVTPIFFQLIGDITSLTYDELKKTSSFIEMTRYVDIPHPQQYTLTICKYTLFFENANEIFYQTLRFLNLRKYSEYASEYAELCQNLEKAISIMESFVETDELASMFQCL